MTNKDPDETRLTPSKSSDDDRTIRNGRSLASHSIKSQSAGIPSQPDEFPASSRFPDSPIGRGTRLGKYIIERELGHGGMGVVYLARDTLKEQFQDRRSHVALKVLSAEFQEHPKSLLALQRESSKSQQLAHPNIITVYDFDLDNGMAYMAMEFIEGSTLKDMLSERPSGWPARDAIALVESMAKALGYAHKKGIAHSDFKPGNVMVASDGTVKILDFGLGRAVTNALKDDFDPFELGGMTPAYASPEMLANQPPEPADDVYALGIVAFELLTGRHPFNRRSANTENLRKLKLPMLKGLKRRQRAALERALAPNRASRQPDAEVFLRELRPQVGVRRSIYVVLSVLVAALAAVSYLNLRGEPPDVLYEDLDPASRQQFDKLTTLGDEFNSRGVYQSAFESYVRAYLISEREPRAVDRLESFFDEMTSQQDLPSNAATNLSCKLACLQTNFGYLAKNRTLTAANDTAVAVLKGKRPDCGRCPDYRKTYGVNN